MGHSPEYTKTAALYVWFSLRYIFCGSTNVFTKFSPISSSAVTVGCHAMKSSAQPHSHRGRQGSDLKGWGTSTNFPVPSSRESMLGVRHENKFPVRTTFLKRSQCSRLSIEPVKYCTSHPMLQPLCVINWSKLASDQHHSLTFLPKERVCACGLLPLYECDSGLYESSSWLGRVPDSLTNSQ